MSSGEIRSADIPILLAAILSCNNVLQVDAEKVAKQLGLALASIPPKFTEIRKRYNINVKVVNAGSLQRRKPVDTRPMGPDGAHGMDSPNKPGVEGGPFSGHEMAGPTRYSEPNSVSSVDNHHQSHNTSSDFLL